ncbi:hypothetical protein Sjap_008626 [Stephania japonica]|uniref:Pantoate--beta-alanine ligase n=1 Tax=Stephania japonica TaxID=461633 RepID=A0AAP0JS98_9MAGN
MEEEEGQPRADPLIITDKATMRKWSRTMRAQSKTISLVPTMGYLHQGHISLITQAHTHSDLTVLSIYINPGQFAPSEDLSTYPSDFHADLDKLRNAFPGRGVDVVFHPFDLYDYGEGRSRRSAASDCCDSGSAGNGVVSCVEDGKSGGHETWVRDLDFPVTVIGSEIVRESDGLALSSRNVYLSPEERKKALSISKSLSRAKLAAENGQQSCSELKNSVVQSIIEAGGKVDYAEIVDQDTLQVVDLVDRPLVFCVAAWFGKVRLIDNMEVDV